MLFGTAEKSRAAYCHGMAFQPLALSICCAAAAVQALTAQEPVRYRDFVLGSDLISVAKLAGAAPAAAKVIHARPNVIQHLEWRPRYFAGANSPLTDPVDMLVFKFYDDQLFTIVADYDRRRTEGMSPADMITAISATYGPVSQVTSRRFGTQTIPYESTDTPLAVWGNADYSITLFRVASAESFRLVIAHTRLQTLARAASAAAVRLNAAEAPQRELARQKKEAGDAAAAQEKAKTENKAQFRP